MARIISFGHEPNEVKEKLEKPGIKDYFWSLVNSLDRFTKTQIIFVILIVIITPIITASSIILITRASETASESANLNGSSLNAEVLIKEANQKIKNFTDQTNPTEIITTTQQRKNLMLQLIKEDPKKFLEQTLDPNTIDKLPQLAKNYTEKKEMLEGEAMVIATQSKDNQEKIIYFLDDSKNKKRYNLSITGLIPDITSGKHVTADVYTLDDHAIALPNSDSLKISNPNKVLGATTAPITRTVLLIRVLLSDLTAQTYTDVDTLGRWFNYTYSANAFHKESSYGLVSLTGTVTPYVSVPYTAATACTTDLTMTTAIKNAATAAGYNLSNYETLVYLFPAGIPCNYAALGTVGDSPWNTSYQHQIWFYGNSYSAQDVTQIYAHEFGHTLGMGHANSLSCGAKTIDLYANCTRIPSGDLYDTMGYGYTYYAQNNAPHKHLLGYFSSSNIINVIQTGTYTLYAPETNLATPQVIRIPKSTGDFYFLEYRRPLGAFDNDLPLPVVSGATLYIGNTNLITNSYFRETYLLDTTPGDSATVGNRGFDNASFVDGKTFYDPASTLTITQISHNANAVTLSINPSAAGLPTPTPIPATPTPTPTLIWTFCNVENATCIFPGTKKVRFGASGSYIIKTLTSSTPCTVAAFGSDPKPGIYKHCEFYTSTPPTSWTFKIAANAHARMYTMGTGGCMSSYTIKTWGSLSSSAPANKPVVRTYCGSTQNGVTVYIPSGAFAGKNVRIYPGDGTSVIHN